jgi:hypothetical protein
LRWIVLLGCGGFNGYKVGFAQAPGASGTSAMVKVLKQTQQLAVPELTVPGKI